MKVILRFLFVVPFAFLAACLTSAFAMLWPYLGANGEEIFADPVALVHSGVAFWAQAAQIGSTLLIPWAIFMVASELFRLSSPVFHMAAGVVGAVAIVIAAYGENRPDGGIQATILVAGLVFTLTYWVIAGRSAGHWIRRRRRRSDPPPIPAAHSGAEPRHDA